jgi:transposase
VRLVAAHRESGSIAPLAQGRPAGKVGKLAPHMGFLIEVVSSDPDMTLRELAGALEEATGVQAQLSSIHRALVRAGYSYKKRAGGQRT